MSWVSRPHLLVDTHLKSKQLLSCYLQIHVTSELWQICPPSISAICSLCSANPMAQTSPSTTPPLLGMIVQGSEPALEVKMAHWATHTAAHQPLRGLVFYTVWNKVAESNPVWSLGHSLLPILLGPTALQSFYWKNTFHFCSQPSLPLARRFATMTLGRGKSKVNAPSSRTPSRGTWVCLAPFSFKMNSLLRGHSSPKKPLIPSPSGVWLCHLTVLHQWLVIYKSR